MLDTRHTGKEEDISSIRRWYYYLVGRRDITLLITILIAIVIISQITPYFLTTINLATMGLAIAFNGIVAIGMTILLVGGGFDLSVGSTYGLTATIVAFLINRGGVGAAGLGQGMPVLPSVLIGLLFGALVGALNAVLINRFLLSPLLATLGTMAVLRGVMLLITGGHSIVILSESFTALGQSKILGIQLPFYIMLALVVIGDFLLRRSTYFRQMTYIGINRASAKAAGIPVARVTSVAYILAAVLAAFAGILDGARVGNVYIQQGLGLEFQVITATVIGGAALTGGKGSIFGSLLGVIIMAMLNNVLNLVGFNIFWQNVVVGVVLVLVVALDKLVSPKEVR